MTYFSSSIGCLHSSLEALCDVEHEHWRISLRCVSEGLYHCFVLIGTIPSTKCQDHSTLDCLQEGRHLARIVSTVSTRINTWSEIPGCMSMKHNNQGVYTQYSLHTVGMSQVSHKATIIILAIVISRTFSPQILHSCRWTSGHFIHTCTANSFCLVSTFTFWKMPLSSVSSTHDFYSVNSKTTRDEETILIPTCGVPCWPAPSFHVIGAIFTHFQPLLDTKRYFKL